MYFKEHTHTNLSKNKGSQLDYYLKKQHQTGLLKLSVLHRK